MAKLTEKAILNTFDEMIQEMPFDKITVTALVERCEISPNTFYYHYQDIYALLDQYLGIKLSRNIARSCSYEEWKGILKDLMRDLQNNHIIVKHICSSVSRDRIERYAFHVLKKNVWMAFKMWVDKLNLSEQEHQTITDAFFYSIFGVVAKFIHDDMAGNVDETFDPIFDFLKYSISAYAKRKAVPTANEY